MATELRIEDGVVVRYHGDEDDVVTVVVRGRTVCVVWLCTCVYVFCGICVFCMATCVRAFAVWVNMYVLCVV